ncbi:MAG TPA: hypothetical protein VKZ67_11255 [Natronosporangium sp.]|nr:hypothetical protein [Natronosporangium sp.]
MSSPTVLPAGALAWYAPPPPPPLGRALGRALARAALLLAPVPVALAAADPRSGWLVPAVAVATGWTAVCGLSHLGRIAAHRSGRAAGARLVLLGFAALTAVWAVGLAIPPTDLLGGDRLLAYLVSLPVLMLGATLAVGLATGREGRLVVWQLPALLAAAAVLSGRVAPEPGGPILLAATVVPLLGAVLLAAPGQTVAGPTLPTGHLWRGTGYLGLGLSQALLVMLVLGRVGAPAPVLLPLLLAVPATQVWLAWHRVGWQRIWAGGRGWPAHQHRIRGLAWATVAPLLVPPAAAAGLLATARHLPFQLSRHPDAAGPVLALASGLLLVGVVAASGLLALRHRPGAAIAATLGAVVLLAAELPATVPLGDGSPAQTTTIILLGWYAAVLALVAVVLSDPEASPPRPGRPVLLEDRA